MGYGNYSYTAHAALTIDDAPHPDITPRMLDALSDAGVKARREGKGAVHGSKDYL